MSFDDLATRKWHLISYRQSYIKERQSKCPFSYDAQATHHLVTDSSPLLDSGQLAAEKINKIAALMNRLGLWGVFRTLNKQVRNISSRFVN